MTEANSLICLSLFNTQTVYKIIIKYLKYVNFTY